MRIFHCDCGRRVFFDNRSCLACGRELGFVPERLDLVALTRNAAGELETAEGQHYCRCGNFELNSNCNWLLSPEDRGSLCASCRLNDIIPALNRPDNLRLWTRVEQAKRRLLYSLYKLGLPIEGVDPQHRGLRFRIMEDRRRNPAVFESFVATAHLDGTITLNVAEADDVTRHAVREQMQERYRTVLGHLRHEAGHFYFSRLVDTPELQAACRALFGDPCADYESALRAYYDQGPPDDWPEHYVSAYASSHPAEDFAESFAHFLHIDDALETARAAGLSADSPTPGEDWVGEWVTLAITLNEILRSLGADDPYPFVLTGPVKAKLAFIDRLLRRPTAPQGA